MKKITEIERHAILTGSFLRYAGSYAEMKNMPPVKTGVAKIYLWGTEHRIHVSL